MSEAQELVDIPNKRGAGKTAGFIACILAVIGFLSLSFVFVPLAALLALFGTITAIKHRNITGIVLNVLAWMFIYIGVYTSPILLGMIGLASAT